MFWVFFNVFQGVLATETRSLCCFRSDYSTMTRIWKYYTIPLQGSETMANTLVMSSYPGTITSGDNFFMADSGLVAQSTLSYL